MASDAGPGDGSAARALAAWANSQDGWARLVAQHVLTTNVPLDDEAVESCFSQLLAEKHLSDVSPGSVDPIAIAKATSDDAPIIRLVKIADTVEVNALVDGQEIEFNHSMTVIYGENASGKTGYVRVLKQIAGARSAEPVLPDVYRTTPATPAATIEYVSGNDRHIHQWSASSPGVASLRRVSVFDTPAAPLHVDDDLSYMYTPAGIVLFEYVHSGLTQIKEKLTAQLAARRPKGNPFLSRFRRGTRPHQMIEALRATTNVGELRTLAAADATEKNKLGTLRNQVRALEGNDQNVRLAGARATEGWCSTASKAVDGLLAFEPAAYEAALEAVADGRERVRAATEERFASDELSGLFSDEWKDFIVAADQYGSTHIHKDFPDSTEKCPYCAQKISADARQLLRKYEAYLTDESQRALSAAAKSLTELTQPIIELALPEPPQDPESAPHGQQEPWMDALRRVRNLLASQQERVRLGKPWHRDDDSTVDLKSDRETIRVQWETSRSLVESHTAETADREDRLAKTKKALADLEDRATLRELLPAVEEHVDAARWADLATTLLSRFQGLLRGLTDATKAATSDILNSNFEAAFQTECTLLACPSVRLEFPGRQGASLRHKSVGRDHKLAQVLSEGEQRVIALADFLAEVSLRPSSAPIVLDDPISSLDSSRADEVADRLVALSSDYQVIVFTHHLYFASKLLAAFEPSDLRNRCSFFEVLAEDGAVGLVQRGTHPRTDTVRAIGGRINKTMQDARASSGSARNDLIATCYGHVRAWIEAFVEDELLQGAVKRHRANISVDALGRVNGQALDAAIAVLTPVYDRACRRIWPHSQTLDQLQTRATIEELESDWEALTQVADQVKAG